MAYYDVALLASDQDFAKRSMAAYATETLADATADAPEAWWSTHAWDMAAQPGFGDAYASALAGEVEQPGRDPSVITDAQLLSAVQSVLAQQQAPDA